MVVVVGVVVGGLCVGSGSWKEVCLVVVSLGGGFWWGGGVCVWGCG